eukprot:1400490-Pleurochrysis_carterae.AAC.1
MASYGKRKFASRSTRSVRRRVSRPRNRPSTRRFLAKRRYALRSRRTKRKMPHSLVRNGRLPSVAHGSFTATFYVNPNAVRNYKLRANFIHTGTGTDVYGVASSNLANSGLNTQVPKGYDIIAGLYQTARVYASKATFIVHNQQGDENYTDEGALHIFGSVNTNKTTYSLPTVPEKLMQSTIPGLRHKLVTGGPGSTRNVKSITKK